MSRAPNTIVLHMVAFFAANPDEELTTGDICAKTGLAQGEAYGRLAPAVKRGLLVRTSRQTGNLRHPCVYTAGPVLLGMIGRG